MIIFIIIVIIIINYYYSFSILLFIVILLLLFVFVIIIMLLFNIYHYPAPHRLPVGRVHHRPLHVLHARVSRSLRHVEQYAHAAGI